MSYGGMTAKTVAFRGHIGPTIGTRPAPTPAA